MAWQLPTLAGGAPPTTLGVKKLNFCVRHGNRCILLAIITTPLSENFVLSKLKLYFIVMLFFKTHHAEPYGSDLVKSSTD